PGVVLTAAALALTAAVLFSQAERRTWMTGVALVVMAAAFGGQLSGIATFDIGDAKGHVGDIALFTKWNSFSRIGVYERKHDTWAATAAGAYTLTENTLYTVEAFNDYIDHLTDDGVLTMTRWVLDGLRLVSLAQEAGQARGWDVSKHLAIVQYDRVQTFMLKKSEFTREEIATLREA